MGFSDPRHPRATREFAGMTAMTRDDPRGLVFIANAEGIWILRQNQAQDPEVEKACADYVRYSHWSGCYARRVAVRQGHIRIAACRGRRWRTPLENP